MAAATRSGTITTADKATIWYEVHGDDKPKDSVPLLLIMGLSGLGTDFYPLVQSIARKRQAIIVDNRGLGKSKFPLLDDGSGEEDRSELSHEIMGFDALTVVKALGYSTIDLLGWSMGGHIAQFIASHESGKTTPDGRREVQGVKIRNLILTATMTKLPRGDFSPDGMAEQAAKIKDKQERQKFIVSETVKLQYFPEWIEASPKNKELVQRRIDDVFKVSRPQIVIALQVTSIAEVDTREALSRIPSTLPVFVIHGKRDRMVAYSEVDYILRRIPHAQMYDHPEVGREFGHWWYDFGSDVSIWADAINAFLDTGKMKL